MLNSLKNSFELFKVQLKWNAKSFAFWLTIGLYLIISTGLTLTFGIVGLTLNRGQLNDGTYNEVFITIAIIIHIVMIAILISVFCVRVFVNNIKHKVVELEKNAGYNKIAIFFSRLTWLVTTIFSTIIVNLLLSSIFFAILSKEGYSDFLYALFIGIYGWEIVFALVYLLLFLVILFLMGPTRASLLIIIILFLFNMAPIQNVTGGWNEARDNELDWTVDKSLWFDDSILNEDKTFNNLKNFFNNNNNSYYGYEYAVIADYNPIEPEKYVETKAFFDNLNELTKNLNWSQSDVYLFNEDNNDIRKTIYDVKDAWEAFDYANIDDSNKLSFNLLNHYMNKLDLLDSSFKYSYSYWRSFSSSEKVKLSEAYKNNPSMALFSTVISTLFKDHTRISEKMRYTKDGETVIANSYSDFVKGMNSLNGGIQEWYIVFNPTKSEAASMMLNPFTHFALMQRASMGLNAGLKEAITYSNSSGNNALYARNIKITYNKDGSFKGYERIVLTEWLFVFYAFLALILLPLTYLMWRRKN
ncbi:hypothetical protein STIUS_v1c00730 [Spiroplasma sp. TIUS-1]|uniref:hypothetical protein n=1 Tax=Spiroplasma sp. TIUS-1 TaxID=216963 RepID=UPI001398AE27|nr:hypothetical protein [Spiroplasma sp. TIUS-1]QHX35628.1 hypothetical protein STIUS_v1c00730 [Spiroplasma sp. TIUS-1]